MFRNVGSKERLVDRVVHEIQNEISEGRLTPGMRLPPERELCEQFGVSRTALREAVRMLVSRGLLETRPGVGTTVRQITTDYIKEPLSMMINQTGPINLEHLNQVRQILEVEIARLAAGTATDEDIANLQAIFQEMINAKDDPAVFNDLDTEFHQALADITHNPLLVLLLDTLREAMHTVRMMVSKYEGLANEVIPDHELILRHVVEKNPGLAGQAMRNHLENARRIQKMVFNGNQEH